MKNFLKKLFCKHSYQKIAWCEEYDEYRCSKCGKRIWVDGRCDPYF